VPQSLIPVLAFLSGAVALAHQLMWMRRMIDLLGAGVESHARVIGIFFLGLALGSAVAGWLTRRIGRPWFVLGWVEIMIALLAVPLLFAPALMGPLWAWMGAERTTGFTGSVVLFTIPMFLVFPPAALMGFFLPMAIAGLPESVGRSRYALFLYGVNTIGAVAGIALVLAVLWQRMDLQSGLLVVICGNLVVGAGCFLLHGTTAGRSKLVSDTPSNLNQEEGFPGKRWLILAGVSGFLVLASEIVAIELLQLLMPMAFFAPGAVLGAVVFVLALGGLAVAVFESHARPQFLGIILWIGALLICVVPFAFLWLAQVLPVIRDGVTLSQFLMRLAIFSLLVLGPAFFITGLVFPLAAKFGAGPTPSKWGWMLAVNGMGGWLGTEIAFRYLLPLYGPHAALGILGFLYAGCACMLLEGKMRAASWLAPTSAAVCLLLAVWILPQLPQVHPQFVPFVIGQWHGRDGSLAVLEGRPFGRSMLVANQYLLGSTAAKYEQERQAHIPLLLHPAPRHVGFLGVATGITPGGALLHPEIERVEAVEISPQVLRAAEDFFSESNRGVLSNPRVHVDVADARTWLASRKARFDVLCGDLFLPWGPGEARLFSLEHFLAARDSLRQGGIFVQWLPMYQLTNDQFMMIAGTFLEVFSPADVILRDDSASQPVLGLVGWKNTRPKFAPRCPANLGDPFLKSAEALGKLHVCTLERGMIQAPRNTLNTPVVEQDASRMRVTQADSAPYLKGAAWQTWVDSLKKATGQSKSN
jgi:spermidine synthase